MKLHIKLLRLIGLLWIAVPAFSQVSVSMGPGYEYDVYYSLQDGVVEEMVRTDWDLGFFTDPESGGIILNGANGCELYTYPNGDTTAWLDIDTTGLSTWTVLFDGEDKWENGAFNRGSLGYPDFGWGVKDDITNRIIGDSLFIIKLADGTYKQLWIAQKSIDDNEYIIRYADIDNSNDDYDVLDVTLFEDMNIAYYNFDVVSLFEREPYTGDWDILFTRYQAFQPQGLYYPVTGVLCNLTLPGNRFHPVSLDYNDWFTQSLDTVKGLIGSNWKYFDFSTGWNLRDSLIFFVNTPDGSIHKIYFTHFAGTTSGDIEFEQIKVSSVNLPEQLETGLDISLTPNPATSKLTINWSRLQAGHAVVRITDLTGKEMISQVLSDKSSMEGSLSFDVSSIPPGMYLVNIVVNGAMLSEKLIIR